MEEGTPKLLIASGLEESKSWARETSEKLKEGDLI